MRATTIGLVLLSAAAACGDVTSGNSADRADAGGAGGADAAQPGPVQVTVLSRTYRAPLPDIPVYFFGPDGALEDTVDTGDDGVATADLLAGGAVFAKVPAPIKAGAPMSEEVWGVLDVRPGDEILLAGNHDRGLDEYGMTVTLPVGDAFETYVVTTPCGTFSSGTNIVAISFYEECDPDTFPWFATAFAGVDRYYIEGDDDAVPSEGDDIPVSDEWTLFDSEEVDLTDIPPEVVTIVGTLSDARKADEYLFLAGISGNEVDASSSSGTLSFPRAHGVDELALALNLYTYGLGGKQLHYRWSDAGDDTPPVSVEDVVLPWVGTPIYEAGARRFSFPVSGGRAWDATGVHLYWSKTEGKTITSGRWTIIGPPGVNEIVLPELPDALAEILPTDVDLVDVSIQLTESAGLDGWEAARPLGLDTYWEDWFADPRAGATTSYSFDPPAVF